MSLNIQRVITRGVIGRNRPDGGIALENNVWIAGDETTALIIDAAHDAAAIAAAVGEREALGILLTHGHEDHINAALELAARLDTHIYLHPADLFLWEATHGDEHQPDFALVDGAEFAVGGVQVQAIHTPGHTPGSMCFYVAQLGLVFSGDTLFQGGPGATRWEYSSFPQIIASIKQHLLRLPGTTQVSPGHGADTTIGAEITQIAAWEARGW